MAHLLRKRIKELEEKVNELVSELEEWQKVGDEILKISHWKKITPLLEKTKYFLLMVIYKTNQAQENIKQDLDEALFGNKKKEEKCESQ